MATGGGPSDLCVLVQSLYVMKWNHLASGHRAASADIENPSVVMASYSGSHVCTPGHCTPFVLLLGHSELLKLSCALLKHHLLYIPLPCHMGQSVSKSQTPCAQEPFPTYSRFLWSPLSPLCPQTLSFLMEILENLAGGEGMEVVTITDYSHHLVEGLPCGIFEIVKETPSSGTDKILNASLSNLKVGLSVSEYCITSSTLRIIKTTYI